jgi:hypothetical protein
LELGIWGMSKLSVWIFEGFDWDENCLISTTL